MMRDKKELTAAKKVFLDLLPQLKKDGVSKFAVTYDGEHDDGAIDGAFVMKKNSKEWAQVNLTEPVSLAAFNLVYYVHPGWETAGDDIVGGQGKIVLNVRTKKITVDHNYKIVTTQFERTGV
jgi:hypothetical protein